MKKWELSSSALNCRSTSRFSDSFWNWEQHDIAPKSFKSRPSSFVLAFRRTVVWRKFSLSANMYLKMTVHLAEASVLEVQCRLLRFNLNGWKVSRRKKNPTHCRTTVRRKTSPNVPDSDYCNTSIAIGCPAFPQDRLLLRFLCIICRRTAHIKFAIITSRFEIGRFTSAGLRSEKKWWNSVGLSSQFHRLIEWLIKLIIWITL